VSASSQHMRAGQRSAARPQVCFSCELRAGVYDLPFSAPVVRTATPDGAAALAARLRDRGAKMYGAFWCSHCFQQKETFGAGAQAALPYIECYPDGYKGPQSINRACKDAGIDGFPTWVIDGQKLEGELPLAALEEVLDGADPKEIGLKYR
jgi:hypothetical protein